MFSQDDIRTKLLTLIRRDIIDVLQPELDSQFAKYTADRLADILDYLIMWAEGRESPEVDGARAALAARLEASLGATKPVEKPLLADFDDRSGAAGRLATMITAISDDPKARLPADLMGQMLRTEEARFDAERAAIEASRVKDKAMTSSIDVEITPALLDAYFAQRPQFQGLKTRSIRKIPGGMSKDTFLIGTESGKDLIIRRDFAFGPTETSAPDEFDLLSRLAAMGMPVARPYAAEYDRSLLGQPVLITERMPGDNGEQMSAADPEVGRWGALELARILGRLHAVPPQDLGFPVDAFADKREPVRAYIAQWRAHWERHRLHTSPLLEFALDWVNRNIPTDIPRLVIVHGDARPDNMLIKDGTVSALLDWEFNHVGDPSEDLEYTKGFAARYVDWAEFLDAYVGAGGARANEGSGLFYEVWRSLRNAICCDVSWGGFVRGYYPVMKLAAQGVIYRRMITKELVDSLLLAKAL